jgi:uridine monophosphate synthetase
MSFFDKLTQAVAQNESLLCVGLDPTPEALPTRYRIDKNKLMADLLRWHLTIIEETSDLVCTYKPNIAFYEALGEAGMALLRDTLAAIPQEIPVILDAKRGDMGSTAMAYAKACFEVLNVDAVTLNPYLGRDSIDPFIAYADRGLFLLCHTSNPGAEEFQTLPIDGRPLYLHIAETVTSWSPSIGLVVGATYPKALRAVRNVVPNTWFLVPGVGAQGGDIEAAIQAGLRDDGSGLIVNVTRGVTLAADHRAAAQEIRNQINQTCKETAT